MSSPSLFREIKISVSISEKCFLSHGNKLTTFHFPISQRLLLALGNVSVVKNVILVNSTRQEDGFYLP